MTAFNIFITVIYISHNTYITSANPTYYTPFVDICDYTGARNASKPTNSHVFPENQVHSGYFTVHKKLNTSLFSVFVKSAQNWTKAPLIIWLQGQPQCTSLYGLFGQHGPYYVDKNYTFVKRPYAWTNEHNVLYLDNMIFTGYSHSASPTNIMAILEDHGFFLYEALYQFYQIFPELINTQLYLAGEMFSGKYILLLAYTIHQRNPISHIKMPLQGLYIGSGYCDPLTMMDYSALLYQIGMIDFDRMKDIENLEEAIRKGIRAKRYVTAHQQLQSIWIEIQNIGFDFPMDFTQPDRNYEYHIFDYLNSPQFRELFNLHDATFYSPYDKVNVSLDATKKPEHVKMLIEQDALRSAKKVLPLLLDNYRILFYGGQFDLIVPFVHVSNFLRKLVWKGAEELYNHEKTPRNNWYVDNELAGYWKTVRNLTEVLVRNAAQMIDVSQPKWAYTLLNKFVNNEFKHRRSHNRTS